MTTPTEADIALEQSLYGARPEQCHAMIAEFRVHHVARAVEEATQGLRTRLVELSAGLTTANHNEAILLEAVAEIIGSKAVFGNGDPETYPLAEEVAVALRAEVEALREDKELVDFLQSEARPTIGKPPVIAIVVKRNHERQSCQWCNVDGDIRAAINAARGTT